MIHAFDQYVELRKQTLEKLLNSDPRNLLHAIGKIIETFNNNGKLFTCGNGGSAADAQHVAAEFVNGMSHPNDLHLPAISLTTDTSILTSHANDYNFDGVFELQLRALASPGDCVLLLTTSGKSRNILQALKYCQNHDLTPIVITGNNSLLENDSTIVVSVPSANTQIIQEMTLIVEHFICEKVIEALKPARSHVS